MSYLVMARRWRPKTFSQVVGQNHVTRTLQQAIARGRVAHAYLFTGPRGVGKTTIARLLAKAVNCKSPCSILMDYLNRVANVTPAWISEPAIPWMLSKSMAHRTTEWRISALFVRTLNSPLQSLQESLYHR